MSRLNKTWIAGEGRTAPAAQLHQVPAAELHGVPAAELHQMPASELHRKSTAEPHRALATELHSVLDVSHRQAKGIIDSGCVKVNGEVVHKYGQRLNPGDKLEVSYDPETSYQTLPQPRKQLDKAGFRILWEDTHLVFVDKPAGLLTVPSEKGQEACLAEAITDHYRRRGFKRFQLYIIHRLDRFSSGVLVFAKTPEALHGLKRLFEEHHLNRIYKAILVGEIPENTGTLTGKLVEHAKSLRMSVVQPRQGEPKGAKHAITHYRVLERLPGHTVVEVKLETGRRNQIRVQFADRGFPLLGDQVYGVESALIDRQALHAELLGFRHPVTGEAITISAPLPSDMEAALKALRNQRRVERAVDGVQGEEGIYRPKITKARKFDRVKRAQRYGEEGDARPESRSDARPGRFGERSAASRPGPDGEGRRFARSERSPRGAEGRAEDRPRREPRAEGEAPRPASPRSAPSRPVSSRPASPRTTPDSRSGSRPRRSAEGEAPRSDRPRTPGAAPRGASRGPGSKPRAEGPKRTDGPKRSFGPPKGKPRGGKK